MWAPSRRLGSSTVANWVSFDFNVAYSSCRGFSLINTLKLKKKSPSSCFSNRVLRDALRCVQSILALYDAYRAFSMHSVGACLSVMAAICSPQLLHLHFDPVPRCGFAGVSSVPRSWAIMARSMRLSLANICVCLSLSFHSILTPSLDGDK